MPTSRWEVGAYYEGSHVMLTGFRGYFAVVMFLLFVDVAVKQDARRMPVYNPAGKYLVKLTVNGVSRKVTLRVHGVENAAL